MINNKNYEKENFRALIKGDDIGKIEDRLNIIDAFLDVEEHVTFDDLMILLKERGYDYDPDFVRRCMNRWVEQGFAQKETFEGQPPRYEHRHLGRHHDHFICTKCARIIEFSNEEMELLQGKIAVDHGFHVLQHKMEIYGLCSECMAERSPLLPLSMAKAGEEVVIRDIIGGRGVIGRMAAMGLRQGDLLEVINNEGHGRLIVGHGSTRMAIGRSIAQKLIVSVSLEKQAEQPRDPGFFKDRKMKKRKFFW